MPELTIREAMKLEDAFLGGLNDAQDAYESIVEHEAWTTLGYDSYADWWQDRVVPVMRALSMRPTTEIATTGIEQVRQEEAALPPAQRRTQQELADMFGVSRDTAAGRKRQDRSGAGIPHGTDLEAVDDPPAAGPDPDQPDDTTAEAPLPGLDDDGDDSRVPESDEAQVFAPPRPGGTDGHTPETGPSVPPAADSPPTSTAAEAEDQNGGRQQRRRPIPDVFRDAVHQLIKDVERVERIVLDDRWPRNAAKVAPASRNDLRRAIDLLAAVADRVPN